jgi:twitching motility protein PilU
MAPGSQTFEQALYQLYLSGKVTLDEAMANADSPTNLHWLVNNAPKATAQAATSQPAAAPAPGRTSPDDLSNIKLNLDALG